MHAAGIAGYRRRRRVRTTVPDRAGARCPDLLRRDFTAPAPQPQVRRRHSPTAWEVPPPTCPWPTGRTCTWLPSSTAHGRRLVGWALRDHMRTPPWSSRPSSRPRPLEGA
ncbi:hypothetical protein BKH10_13695 [Actinomyces naeslundii]|nr:hypothetical protein BKH10_13695 [Actinomyces naeslundii]